MQAKALLVLLTGVAGALAAGCTVAPKGVEATSDSHHPAPPPGADAGVKQGGPPGAPGPGGSPGPGTLTQVTLQRMQSCAQLTAALVNDARSKMNRRIDAEIQAVRQGWGNASVQEQGGFGAGAATTANAAPPQAAVSMNSASTPSSAPPAHSNTETQVMGVDEADIVKTDGNYIYLLHGDQFLIVDSWPATSLATASSLTIEGEPIEMFVADGRAVVFSHVDGTAIYAAAHVTPRPTYSDAYYPGEYGGFGGGGVATPGVALAGPPPPNGGLPVNSGGVNYQHDLAKVTVLAISGTQASVTRELYFEGSYLSSRRIDSNVRVILTGGGHGPALTYSPTFPPGTTTTGANGAQQYVPPSTDEQVAAWEAVRANDDALIDQTNYADWLPLAFTKTGSQVDPTTPSCADYWVPTAGTTDFGMTQVESFDLSAPDQPPQGAGIFGDATTVYGNADAIIVASPAYVDPWLVRQNYALSTGATSGTNGSATPPIPVAPLNYTNLHVFDIASNPSTPLYAGSGTVPGAVRDQFALDESKGFVRVTTTEQQSGPPRTDGKSNEVSHVYVLSNDQMQLSITGDSGEIAPGEQLYATRFVGDKAYIVTWNVTDPLFVVDVSDPNNPRVLGQVQIPGFSTYIHPLDDTHLLTIGRETDDTGHQHMGGYWFGIAIQVFDVTNPLAPALQYKYVYDGGEYATTEAMDNHKAFTYFDDRKLLAFPYEHQGSYGSSGPSSTLEVFQVGVAEGITKIGSVSHSALLATLPNGNYGYCGGYYDGTVRRGVFIENFVYSISYGGIIASDVSSLATPVSTLKLNAPTLVGVCQ